MDWANTLPLQKNGLWLLTVCMTWKTLNWLAGTAILRLKPFLFQRAESCILGIAGMPKEISSIPKIKKLKTKYLGWKLVYKKCLSKILYKNITASTCWPEMSEFGTHSSCFHVIKWHIKVAKQMHRTVSLNSPIYIYFSIHPCRCPKLKNGQASEWSLPSATLCVGKGGRSEEHSAFLESPNHSQKLKQLDLWLQNPKSPPRVVATASPDQAHIWILIFYPSIEQGRTWRNYRHGFLWGFPLTPFFWPPITDPPSLLFSLEYVFHISLPLSEQKQSELQNPRTTNHELPWALTLPSRFLNSLSYSFLMSL